MSHTITSLHFDLGFNLSDTPPTIGVSYADVAPGGQEEHVSTILSGDAAWRIVRTKGDLLATLDAVKAEIVKQEDDVKEPGTLAARVAAAARAEEDRRRAQEACDALCAQAEALKEEIDAKRKELSK